MFGNTTAILLIGFLIRNETTQTDKESPVKVVLHKVDTMYWVLRRHQMEEKIKSYVEEQDINDFEIPTLLEESRRDKGREIKVLL